MCYLDLKEGTVLRLQPGDVLLLKTSRPLADSEHKRLMAAWQAVLAERGLENQVAIVLSTGDALTVEVLRGEQ